MRRSCCCVVHHGRLPRIVTDTFRTDSMLAEQRYRARSDGDQILECTIHNGHRHNISAQSCKISTYWWNIELQSSASLLPHRHISLKPRRAYALCPYPARSSSRTGGPLRSLAQIWVQSTSPVYTICINAASFRSLVSSALGRKQPLARSSRLGFGPSTSTMVSLTGRRRSTCRSRSRQCARGRDGPG